MINDATHLDSPAQKSSTQTSSTNVGNPSDSPSQKQTFSGKQSSNPMLLDYVERWIRTPIYPLGLYLTIFSVAFWNNLDIPTGDRTAENIGASFQAVLKIAIILMGLMLGSWGWWSNPRVRALTTSIPGYALFFLGFWQIASGLLSPTVSLSLAMAGVISYWGALLLIMSGIAYLGARHVVYALTAGMATFGVCSILFYFVSPENAIFTEVMDMTNKISRFGGMGHPNSLGRMGIVVAVMFTGLAIDRKIDWRLAIAIGGFFFLEAAATMSRTPLIAGFGAVVAMIAPRISRDRAIYWTGVAGGLAVLLLIVLELTVGTNSITNKILAKGTKTGNIEEVTTLTGRTEIWQFAIELASERPVLGHGPGATPILMEKKSGHAHNVLLDPVVNLGLPAGMAILTVFIWQIYCCYRDPNSMMRGGVTFLILAGLTERLLFGTIPDSISYFWLAFAFWGVVPEPSDHPKRDA